MTSDTDHVERVTPMSEGAYDRQEAATYDIKAVRTSG